MSEEEKEKKGKEECVQVVVRCRPLSKQEIADERSEIVLMDQELGQIRIRNPNDSQSEPRPFTYDAVYDQSTQQEDLYNRTAAKVVDFVLEGFNGTIFAYGQTGTGKTWTMEGDLTNPKHYGITPRTFDHIFNRINETSESTFYVSCQFVEIYQEDVMDLLGPVKGDNRAKLSLKEKADGSVFVAGDIQHVCKSSEQLFEYLEKGFLNRAVGATKMNPGSSRSHCIMTVTVETCRTEEDGQSHIRVGKLNLVDLAGSERQKKTGAEGDRLKEATRINLSLSCLGNVISALTTGGVTHIPYRNSKLTRLLQDSLGGNTKTIMIANIGPADYNWDETVTTLRFATRAKSIKNKPKINEDPKDAMLREYQDEIARLKKALAMAESGEEGGMGMGMVELAAGVANGGALGGPGYAPQKITVPKVLTKITHVGVSKEELEKAQQESEKKRQELEEKHKKETAEILSLKEQIQQQSVEKEQQLRQQQQILEEQQRQQQQLRDQLKNAEEKLVVGKKIMDEAKKQKIILDKRKAELGRQNIEAEQKKRALLQHEEELMLSQQRKAKGEEDLTYQKKKLAKLRNEYNMVKQETEDCQADFQREREDLLEEIRELTRQVQFQDLILTHFVPKEQGEEIDKRAAWDEEKDNWVLKKMDFKTMNIQSVPPQSLRPGMPRPVCDYSRYKWAMGEPSPRYRVNNMLDLELDMPERTTQDYQELRYRHLAAQGGMPQDMYYSQQFEQGAYQDYGAYGGGSPQYYDQYNHYSR